MTDISPATQLAPLVFRRKLLIGLGLLIGSALSWLVTLQQGSGMTVMPTWPIGTLTFVVAWTMMMAAMMLPSALPAVWLFATVAQSRAQFGFRPAPVVIFVTGYLGIWSLMGVGVALVNEIIGRTMDARSQPIVGSALIVAGIYQLTPWKSICLSHCRTPIHFFMEHWHDGLTGAVRMGAYHGLYCVGCCWGLMLALIALGIMNPGWMSLIALLIFVEKVTPPGERLIRLIGVGLLLAGAVIAFRLISPSMGGM